MQEKFYSTKELAELLHMSRISIFKRIKQGRIVAVKVGRNYIVAEKEVHKLIREQFSSGLTAQQSRTVEKAVNKVADEYGATLKLLGRE